MPLVPREEVFLLDDRSIESASHTSSGGPPPTSHELRGTRVSNLSNLFEFVRKHSDEQGSGDAGKNCREASEARA